MGHLNADPAQLRGVAGHYLDLQAATHQLPPKAIAEINRIIDSHGPMGYPVAIGIAAGLARRQTQLEGKAAEFGVYATRFNEHATTYETADHEAAATYRALDFQQGHLPPTPEDDDDGHPRHDEDGPKKRPMTTCWIGTAGGDTSVCSADATDYLYIDSGSFQIRHADTGSTEVITQHPDSRTILLPQPPAPGTDPFAGAPPEVSRVFFPGPNGGLSGLYRPSAPGMVTDGKPWTMPRGDVPGWDSPMI